MTVGAKSICMGSKGWTERTGKFRPFLVGEWDRLRIWSRRRVSTEAEAMFFLISPSRASFSESVSSTASSSGGRVRSFWLIRIAHAFTALF